MAERPLPPPLEFETPPCSICGTGTDYTDGQFRCSECGCSWDRDLAHLYEGSWDDTAAERCPDVLRADEQPSAAGRPEPDYRCVRTAGHGGDHLHPDGGEWISADADGGDDDA